MVPAKAWYEGGTLHNVQAPEWKAATAENQLATAADWAIKVPSVKSQVQASGNIDSARPFAAQLRTCVSKAVEGPTGDSQDSATIAASCVILMGW